MKNNEELKNYEAPTALIVDMTVVERIGAKCDPAHPVYATPKAPPDLFPRAAGPIVECIATNPTS